MQKHEYYEELCALLPIGQLSREESEELAEHLRGCPSCRNATDDFSIILDKMPISETDVDEKAFARLQDGSYRTRFLQRAVAEGVPLSDAVMRQGFAAKKWTWPRLRLLPVFATVATAVAILLAAEVFTFSSKKVEVNARPLVQSVPAPSVARPLQDPQLISQLEGKIETLESQSIRDRGAISELKGKLSQSRAESTATASKLAATTEQVAQLQKQTVDAQHALDAEKEDLKRLRSEKESADAALVDQQFKNSELTAQAKEKDALAERDRQLSTVTRDVRDLMGARNLHILDVSDVDGNGRSGKSFGRVFLVEGRSLIFYAFDLGDRGNPAKVSFQAWAQADGQQNIATNLGVFYVDDHAQKRWVLKVTDPEKLKAINSVFVTVEPLGGTQRPTGKKLLYAYLVTQANHP
jgi:uncharacterized coiled-coil protein SlyX